MAARDDFHQAVKEALIKEGWTITDDPHREPYLAVPADVYDVFFSLVFTQGVVRKHQLKLIVYQPSTEEIVQWIN